MQYIKITNWSKYQHYKNRRPPWIKLYNKLLRKYEFLCLQDDSKLLLMILWLFASTIEQDNPLIPADVNYLRSVLPMNAKIDLQPLVKAGFIEMIADCKQNDSNLLQTRCAETETDNTETDSNIHTHARAKKQNLIEQAFLESGLLETAQDAPQSKNSAIDHQPLAKSIESRSPLEPDGLFTLQNCLDAGIMAGLTNEQSTEFYHHYAAQGWKLGNGMPISNLQSAMTRWKNKGFKFEKSASKQETPEKKKISVDEYRENYKEMTGKYPDEK